MTIKSYIFKGEEKMSFFAGNGKLHITSTQRNITELDTNTIYPDTTFHSDMNVLCSEGEFVVPSTLVDFKVAHGDFPTELIFSEKCFEVALPQQVTNALNVGQVVLVQINTGSGEANINFPVNIKTGQRGVTSSDDADYSVALDSQLTAGGKFDVCFSVNSIKNRTIAPKLVDVGNSGYWSGSGTVFYPTKKIMPWTTNPDYEFSSTNLLKPGVKYAQIHFIGERWRLENTIVGAAGNYRRDNPTFVNPTQTPPSMTFIILNAIFSSDTFTIKNPFKDNVNDGIILEPGKVTVRGRNLTSIKLLQSYNPEALGEFKVSNDLNRVLACTVNNNVSIKETNSWSYKKYDSFIFTQGARYPNGVALLRPVPGGTFPEYLVSNSSNSTIPYNDTLYYSAPMTPITVQDPNAKSVIFMGTPVVGVYKKNYPNIYYTDTDKLLLSPVAGYQNAIVYKPKPFALIDTSTFTGLYIDKDGIKGDYRGKIIPVYNNLSAPTYLIEVTKSNFSPSFTIVKEGSSEFVQDLYDINATRERESLLVAVRIGGSAAFTGSISWPYMELAPLQARIQSSAFSKPLDYSNVFGLVKLTDTQEVLLTHGYFNTSLKWYDGSFAGYGTYDCSSSIYMVYITISLKRVGSRLQIVTRAVMDYDKRVATNSVGDGYDDIVFNWITVPSIRVAVTKIQS